MTAVLLAGAALRRFLFGAKSLWYDEASSLLLAGLPLSRLGPTLVSNEGNPPLHALIMHFWVPLFSDPRIGLRAFSMLCGIVSVFVFRSLAERLLPPRARSLAVYLAAFSSYWIHLAQDGRVYALLLLLGLLATRVVLDLTRRPTARLWALYAALAAAGLYAHYYFLVLLAAHASWLLWTFRGSPRERRRWLAAHAAAAILFLPWLPSLREQLRVHVADPVLGEALTPWHLLDSLGTTVFDVSFLGLLLPWWLNAAVGAGVAALAAAAAARARRLPPRSDERRALVFTLAHVAIPLALIALVELVLRRPVTQARYFAPLSPFLFLLAASELSSPGRWTRAARLTLQLVVAVGAVGYFASAVYIDPRLDRLSAIVRATDSRLPCVHLGAYYYLPMRVYYLPERPQYLLADAARGMDFRGMPPYGGVMDRARLPRVGPCVVIDESQRLSPHRVWIGTGAQLAARLAASAP